MKKIIYLLAIALLSTAQQVFCQCPATGVIPTTNDLIARPSLNSCTTLAPEITTTANTGYDIYWDAPNLRNMQVMVWDQTNASFSWNYGGAVNSIAFSSITQIGAAPRTLVDPDVVVQNFGGAIYAMIVGIASCQTVANNGRVFWISYRWNGATFQFNASGFLGSNTGLGCKNPNIDVNACGHIVVVWHWERTEVITLTSSGTNYNFGPIAQNVLRADVYAAYGRIDGSGCVGVISGAGGNLLGDLISTVTAINHLFEKNMTPDVCISDRTGASCANYNITYTWQQSWFDPATFTYMGGVAVKQYNSDFNTSGCIGATVSNYFRLLNFGGHTERPRIAARPTSGTGITQYTDFQIVLAYFGIGCTVSTAVCPATCSITVPVYPATAVLNWGRHNGVDINGSPFPAVNLTALAPCDLSNYYYNNNAVVSYLNTAFNTNGDYSVAWEHAPNPVTCVQGITNNTGVDIVSRTYNNCNTIVAAPRYSIVNRNICNANTQLGNQLIPSIGGRHASSQMGFDFWDTQIAAHFYIGYKATSLGNIPGGAVGLRIGNSGSPDVEDGVLERVFNVSPNPFSDEVTFYYSLPENEMPSAIEIFDTQGHLVRQINLDNKSTQETIHLDVPSGIYITKLKTSNGEVVTKITKTE